jgi:hypothetical protein
VWAGRFGCNVSQELHGLTTDGLLQRFAPIMIKPGTFAQDIETEGPHQDYADLTRRLIRADHAQFVHDDDALDEMNKLRRRVSRASAAASPKDLTGSLVNSTSDLSPSSSMSSIYPSPLSRSSLAKR